MEFCQSEKMGTLINKIQEAQIKKQNSQITSVI